MVGLSLYSIVPVRTDAREGAEQSTQILFGETFDILEQIPRWHRVKLHKDGQEGWVDSKMITPMSPDEYKQYGAALKSAATVVFPMVYAMSENNGQTIPLTAGTKLTHYQTTDAGYGHFEVLGVGFRIDPSMVRTQPLELNEQNLLQTVRFFLNVPYLWGGKNALGMDCSGFTQVIMSLFGKKILRNASEQATQGRAVSALNKAKAGDLVFCSKYTEDDTHSSITHVGLVIDPQRVIHCSGRVKVEKLDETGIYSTEQGGYTHRLVSIRRF